MVNFSNLELDRLAVHRVGNKYRAEKNFISNELLQANEKLQDALLHYFLKPIKRSQEWCHFRHSSDLQLNEVYTYAKTIFQEPDRLLEQSIHILHHLYGQSEHPNIKSGELYVVLFRDILLEDELIDALGIFKSEQKHSFLKVSEKDQRLVLDPMEGIHLDKLDKGCLILNTLEEEGFRLLSIDQNNYDAQYWRDDFLQIDYVNDAHFHTRRYLELVEDFSKTALSPESNPHEQVKFMADSVAYFQNHETFDVQEFAATVIPNETGAERFRSMQGEYGLEEIPQFEISPTAFKASKRKLKSQINLDTHIQIKVDINQPEAGQQYIEKGFDEDKGMYYYKVFYNEELP